MTLALLGPIAEFAFAFTFNLLVFKFYYPTYLLYPP